MLFYLIAFPAQAIPLYHLCHQRCQHGCSIAKGHHPCLCCLLHHNWSEPLALHLCCLPDHGDIPGWFLTASPLLCAQTLLTLSECWWDEFVKHGCVSASYPPETAFNFNSLCLNQWNHSSENGATHRTRHRLNSHSLPRKHWRPYCPQRGRTGKALDLVIVQGVSLGFCFTAGLA